ncbi:MAG: MIP/aquaporin family protein [Caulobacteraceae bacterium]
MSHFMGELIGTMILIIFGGGVCAGCTLNKSKSQNSGWIVIIMGWGLAVAMAVYAVGRISGAHLNPAVTIALATIGSFPWAEVPSYIIAQMLGAIIGAAIVWLAYLPHWAATENKPAKLGVFSTAPAIKSNGANILCEAIGTAVLVLGILAIGANKIADGLNPFLVGTLIMAIGLSLGGPTGYAINPARDLGPRIAHAILPIAGKGDSDWGYSWIPVVGPIIGGVVGAFFFKIFFGA